MRTLKVLLFKILFIVLSFIFSTASLVAAGLQGTFESTQMQTNLVELYTSEGCYSCPPADAFLKTLKKDTRLWKEIIPVAFHVDYWDYIGWKDSYATAAFTQRQRDYAFHLRTRSVYTPEFFINGSEWRGFFKKKPLPTPSSKKSNESKSGYLNVSIENNVAKISFTPLTNTATSYNINIAVLGFDLVSDIKTGENEGKTLQHDFVALGHKLESLERKNQNTFHATTKLPLYKNPGSQLGLAAWVTMHNNPIPIQAVGGWLDFPTQQ